MSKVYHLAVAWDWEFDREFIGVLEEEFHACGLTIFMISHHNVEEVLRHLHAREVEFHCFLDRASDGDEKFLPLARSFRRSRTRILNHPDAVHRAADKATMHLEFLTHGINVPFTIIISPYNKKQEVELSLTDLARLGRPFIIKPANTTGGGTGVILGAETLKDVIVSRQHHKNDKYLLQEKIVPEILDGRRAWFRVFWAFGTSIPCWWDAVTHIYTRLSLEEVARLSLRSLGTIAQRIAEVCRLDFFSSEVAITKGRKFVVVDYVNEICDMRLKSLHPDGVPDEIVREICSRVATAAVEPTAGIPARSPAQA